MVEIRVTSKRMDFVVPNVPRTENWITYVAGNYIHRVLGTEEQFSKIKSKTEKNLSTFTRNLGLFAPECGIAYDAENKLIEMNIRGYVKTQNEEVRSFVDSLVEQICDEIGTKYITPITNKSEYVFDFRARR